MKKLLFVYNPRSGKGLIRTSLADIIETFSAADYDVTVYPTRQALDASAAVQERAAAFDMIVCSGGDGTLDEVVTGLLNSGVKRTIGYIPAGSTNDYAVSVGIPRRMEQAAQVIVEGEPFSCDVGRFNERDYFVYVAAFGLLTDVSYQTKQELKNVLGHAAYIVEGMKRLGSWKSYPLEIESEEYCGRGDFIYGMITNSNSVGGIKGLPGRNVELNDGLFEVMLVRTPRDLLDWQKVAGAILMDDESSQSVIRFKTRKLVITSEVLVAWTRDGEDGGEHRRVELENMRQALEIMTEPKQEPEQESIQEPEPEQEQEAEEPAAE